MKEEKLVQLANKFSQRYITGTKRRQGESSPVRFFRETLGTKQVENRGIGQCGIKNLGMCGHPLQPWPLTHILEETDEYIIACCDAGCGTILIKKPVRKVKKQTKRKTKLVITSDGNLEPERKKTHEDNVME